MTVPPESGPVFHWFLPTRGDSDTPEAVASLPGLPVAVPVVLARAGRRHGVTATEVLGSIDAAVLRAAISAGRVDARSPVLDHLADPLPTVGIGHTISEAYDALGRHHTAAVVLLDGRAVCLVARDELDSASYVTGVPVLASASGTTNAQRTRLA